MNKATLKKHARLYRELDALAASAIKPWDDRRRDLYLDARNAIGSVIREVDWNLWNDLHKASLVGTTGKK
jgi:hypothetical protein